MKSLQLFLLNILVYVTNLPLLIIFYTFSLVSWFKHSVVEKPFSRKVFLTVIFAILTTLSYLTWSDTMGLFKKEEVVLFSGFEGKLTQGGSPIAGAKIIRTYELYEKQEDSTVTDDNGIFSFPTVRESYSDRFMTQFVVQQKMFVEYKEKEIQIWGGGKMERGEYSEFNGERKSITCDINDEVIAVILNVGFIATSCKWKNQ